MPELSGWLRIYDSHHTSVMLDLHVGVRCLGLLGSINMNLVPSGNKHGNDFPVIVAVAPSIGIFCKSSLVLRVLGATHVFRT